jgi:hypothetical protein
LPACQCRAPTTPTPTDRVQFGVRHRTHNTPTNLESLIAVQGVRPVARFEDLLGDFWPEDEAADDFTTAVRDWRREKPSQSPAPDQAPIESLGILTASS